MKRAVSFVTLVSGIVLGCLLLTRISSAQENVKWTTESVLTKVDKSASGFRGCVLHYVRVFDLLNVGGQAAEIGCGLIHPVQRALGSPPNIFLARRCDRSQSIGKHYAAYKSSKKSGTSQARPRFFRRTVRHFEIAVIVAHSNGCAARGRSFNGEKMSASISDGSRPGTQSPCLFHCALLRCW